MRQQTVVFPSVERETGVRSSGQRSHKLPLQRKSHVPLLHHFPAASVVASSVE